MLQQNNSVPQSNSLTEYLRIQQCLTSFLFAQVNERFPQNLQKEHKNSIIDQLHSIIVESGNILSEEHIEECLRLTCRLCRDTFDVDSSWLNVLHLITERFIMLTSPKYVFVMYKGCLASFVTESLGKIKLYSVLPLFLPLVSSKAFPDLLQLFEDLHFCEQSLQEEYSEETEKLANTMNISTSIRKQVLKYFLECQVAGQYGQQLLDFTHKIILFLLKNNRIEETRQSMVQLATPNTACDQIILTLIATLNLNPKETLFPALYLQTYLSNDVLYTSHGRFLLQVRSLAATLPDQIALQVNFCHQQQIIIQSMIGSVAQYLLQSGPYEQLQLRNPSLLQTIHLHFDVFSQLVQRLAIYQPAHPLVIKFLSSLKFLHPCQRQIIYSGMIRKHKQSSFRAYCIAQYRKLLSLPFQKNIWRQAGKLLLELVVELLPSFEGDYIGHLITFAYLWVGLSKKVINNSHSHLRSSIINDIHKCLSHFELIKNSLQTKLALPKVSDQQQRNEIEMCIFRIADLAVIIHDNH